MISIKTLDHQIINVNKQALIKASPFIKMLDERTPDFKEIKLDWLTINVKQCLSILTRTPLQIGSKFEAISVVEIANYLLFDLDKILRYLEKELYQMDYKMNFVVEYYKHYLIDVDDVDAILDKYRPLKFKYIEFKWLKEIDYETLLTVLRLPDELWEKLSNIYSHYQRLRDEMEMLRYEGTITDYYYARDDYDQLMVRYG